MAYASVTMYLHYRHSLPVCDLGETGGKDFVVAHPDCDRQGLLVALLRGAFEYQGQKCSAASRAYVPSSVWDAIRDDLVSEISKIKMGDASDFTNFMTAVIDQRAFDKISGYFSLVLLQANS